jgi:hypothetical protein
VGSEVGVKDVMGRTEERSASSWGEKTLLRKGGHMAYYNHVLWQIIRFLIGSPI